ncbi:hypothetical protein, partial [Mycobacterium tuberculosis]|uniref:hypothetical protein n=1 Tax=Mycobacterium tuberculosis TaxID=1773 RepID=UPI001156268D
NRRRHRAYAQPPPRLGRAHRGIGWSQAGRCAQFNAHSIYQYCGDVPPVELEAAYYAQRQRPAAG